MKLIDRHIMRAILSWVGIVVLVLVSLGAFIDMVGQLDDVGQSQYGLPEALSYVALRVPRTIFEMLPAAALLGALLGLGNLASHSELVVMRASGVSRLRLLGSASIAGVLLIVLMALLGESVAPTLGQYARQIRATALLEDVSIGDGQEIWLKDGDLILNLEQLGDDFSFGGVYLFSVPDRSLAQVARADSADIDNSDRWLLRNYSSTEFRDDRVLAENTRQAAKSYDLSPDLLGLSVVRPDLLDTAGLWRYIGYLKSQELDSTRYEVALWTRVANVISVGVMVVLALPFVFGSLRSTGAGARLIVGLMIGLGYYLATQMLASSGEVFDLNPVLVAWAPTGALMLITLMAVLRIR